MLFMSRQSVDGKWRPVRLGARGYSAAGWTAFAVGNAMRFVAMRFGAQTVLAGDSHIVSHMQQQAASTSKCSILTPVTEGSCACVFPTQFECLSPGRVQG